MGMTLWGSVVAGVAATQVERFGRRSTFLFGTSTMLLTYVVWTIVSAINQERNFKDKSLASTVVAMIFVFQLFYHISAPIGFTYVMEVAPFSLRSKAAMIYQFSGSVASVFNSFANPVAMAALPWKYYIVWCGMLALLVHCDIFLLS